MICPRIEALILSEFHHKKGFTIIDVIQHQTHITETQFSIYSQLILYREEMCGHFLVSEFMDKYYVIGIPSLSHNTQDRNVYERAKYLYAVSVLVQKDYYNNQCGREVYKEIVSKLAHFFKFLEEASNVIYYNSVAQNKQYLHNLLQKSYRHINNNQQLVLSHFSNCFTIINLNRCQLPFALNQKKSKVVIKKSHVPITYLLDSDIQDIQSQFGKKLLSYAQIGDFNVRKIGDLLQDYDKVVAFYAKAVEMGIVYLADMFALQNRYALTPQIHRYVGDRRKKEQEQMLKICEEVSLKKAEHPKLTPNALLFLYLQLSRMSTLKKIINSNLLLFSNINVIKWIRISQMLGLIYRVHEKLAIENSSFYQQNFSNSVISNQSANESFGYNQNSRESQFISEERVRLYLQPKSVRSGSWVLNVKEEWERMNGLFNMHLKNMDNLDEICVNMRVSRCILFGLINFNSQRALKVYYVDQ